jgi:uncharacterized protein YndB with AHSA1/START domain
VTANDVGAPAPLVPGAAGELRIEGELATLVFRRLLRHPPRLVWEAITEPDQIRVWFMTEAKIEPRKGGRVELVTGPARVSATGRILEWDPPRVYEYEWNIGPSAFTPKGEASVVRWELTPTGEGTLLVLTHRRLTRATATVFSRGVRAFLNRLAAQLDGVLLPDWQSQVDEQPGPGSESARLGSGPY